MVATAKGSSTGLAFSETLTARRGFTLATRAVGSTSSAAAIMLSQGTIGARSAVPTARLLYHGARIINATGDVWTADRLHTHHEEVAATTARVLEQMVLHRMRDAGPAQHHAPRTCHHAHGTARPVHRTLLARHPDHPDRGLRAWTHRLRRRLLATRRCPTPRRAATGQSAPAAVAVRTGSARPRTRESGVRAYPHGGVLPTHTGAGRNRLRQDGKCRAGPSRARCCAILAPQRCAPRWPTDSSRRCSSWTPSTNLRTRPSAPVAANGWAVAFIRLDANSRRVLHWFEGTPLSELGLDEQLTRTLRLSPSYEAEVTRTNSAFFILQATLALQVLLDVDRSVVGPARHRRVGTLLGGPFGQGSRPVWARPRRTCAMRGWSTCDPHATLLTLVALHRQAVLQAYAATCEEFGVPLATVMPLSTWLAMRDETVAAVVATALNVLRDLSGALAERISLNPFEAPRAREYLSIAQALNEGWVLTLSPNQLDPVDVTVAVAVKSAVLPPRVHTVGEAAARGVRCRRGAHGADGRCGRRAHVPGSVSRLPLRGGPCHAECRRATGCGSPHSSPTTAPNRRSASC